MARRDNSIDRRQFDALVGYDEVLADLVGLLEGTRRAAARSVNALMTATYWLVGRQIVEGEDRGKARASADGPAGHDLHAVRDGGPRAQAWGSAGRSAVGTHEGSSASADSSAGGVSSAGSTRRSPSLVHRYRVQAFWKESLGHRSCAVSPKCSLSEVRIRMRTAESRALP
jgi:hypothetical protein